MTTQQKQAFKKIIDKEIVTLSAGTSDKVAHLNFKLVEAFKVQSVPFTIVAMPNEKLKYPELGLKDDAYYFRAPLIL